MFPWQHAAQYAGYQSLSPEERGCHDCLNSAHLLDDSGLGQKEMEQVRLMFFFANLYANLCINLWISMANLGHLAKDPIFSIL